MECQARISRFVPADFQESETHGRSLVRKHHWPLVVYASAQPGFAKFNLEEFEANERGAPHPVALLTRSDRLRLPLRDWAERHE